DLARPRPRRRRRGRRGRPRAPRPGRADRHGRLLDGGAAAAHVDPRHRQAPRARHRARPLDRRRARGGADLMKTILVTGGAGFIALTLVRHPLGARAAVGVVVLDKLTYAGTPRSLRELDGEPRLAFVRGDIGDRALVRDLLATRRPDAVVNLAAESHVDRSIV